MHVERAAYADGACIESPPARLFRPRTQEVWHSSMRYVPSGALEPPEQISATQVLSEGKEAFG